jgi:hypothetical protein
MDDPMLQFFQYGHLPAHLQEVSGPFGELARQIVQTLPANPERTAALRKLSEQPTGDFGWALAQLRSGHKVTRSGWNGKGMWLSLQVPDAHSKMGMPYLYISLPCGKLLPWVASHTDMLSWDWGVYAG